MFHTQPGQLSVSSSVLTWLTDVGRDVPSNVRAKLRGELLSSTGAVVMATLVGLMLNLAAIFLHYLPVFALFAVLDLAVGAARVVVLVKGSRARAAGGPVRLDPVLFFAIAWCALQGVSTCVAMSTGNPSLQVLASTFTMGLIGPICARNYPAPRFALLLVCLCDLPFVVGCCLAEQPWLLMVVLMTPPFLFGVVQIVRNNHQTAVAALTGQSVNEHLARHDPLTGLRNRLGLNDAVESALAYGSGRAAVLYLDLDGFKFINDTLGHHVGDCVLVSVARRIEAAVRPEDLVFRIGGDEFVVLARDIGPDEAESLASRLIRDISREAYDFDGETSVNVGASAGFACAPDDAISAEELHRKADGALYASKAAGKGRPQRGELRLVS